MIYKIGKLFIIMMLAAIIVTACGTSNDGNVSDNAAGSNETKRNENKNTANNDDPSGPVVLTAFSEQDPRVISFDDNEMTYKIEETLA